MGRTLREPPYGLAEPFPIRVPAGSKHQKALERSGLIPRGRTAQLRDSPVKETATPATEGGGSAFAFTRKEKPHQASECPAMMSRWSCDYLPESGTPLGNGRWMTLSTKRP